MLASELMQVVEQVAGVEGVAAADRSITLTAEERAQHDHEHEASLTDAVKRMFEDEGFRAERVRRLVGR